MIKQLFPFPRHRYFVDVFGGSGVVILNKAPADFDMYNDLNGEVWNLFKTMKESYTEFMHYSIIHGSIAHPSVWKECRSKIADKSYQNEIERAFCFHYAQAHSFHGLGDCYVNMIRSGDNTRNSCPHSTYLDSFTDKLLKVWKRIQKIDFQNRDFRDLWKMELFGFKNTLIYCDPPYFTGTEHYESVSGGSAWSDKDMDDLLERMNGAEALVCLSIDRTVNELGLNPNKWYEKKIIRQNRSGSRTGEKTKDVIEYVITNYDTKNVSYQMGPVGNLLDFGKTQ